MLFIYAWLFFLFSTSVVALPAGESSGRSSRHKHQKVVISYGSTDRGSTPLPPPRPQTTRPGGRTVYPTRDSRNGLWTAKQLQVGRILGFDASYTHSCPSHTIMLDICYAMTEEHISLSVLMQTS